jgi:GNAT superfamily N-acetyltransferase
MSINTTIVTFDDSHIDEAVSLLVERHKITRIAYPFLPDLTLENARKAIQTVREKPHTMGVVAIQENRVVSYLIGTEEFSALRGRTVWISEENYALEAGQSTELYREMYAVLAQIWVSHGVFDQYVMALAHDRNLVDTWFSLGFAQQQGHGILSLTDYATTELTPEGITIRQIQPGDETILKELSSTIAEYQTHSPVFAPAPPEYLLELQEGFSELLQDDDCTMWLAERDGEVLAFQGYFTVTADPTIMINPENCVELSIAGTKMEARGTGLGTALTQHGLKYMKEQGYAYCITDWRVTNLFSSRFWEARFGFTPVVYRLERRINPTISWANCSTALT